MTADEARIILRALATASEELEIAMDLRDVPDAVLDALDATRDGALRYAGAAPDPEAEDPCQA